MIRAMIFNYITSNYGHCRRLHGILTRSSLVYPQSDIRLEALLELCETTWELNSKYRVFCSPYLALCSREVRIINLEVLYKLNKFTIIFKCKNAAMLKKM